MGLLTVQNMENQQTYPLKKELAGLPVLDILANDEKVRLDEAFDDLTVPLLT